ncbi:hypothetical protein [Arthrobacter bambusae]|uniref:hypothetical protein n=1 Tax=Arthrobacter bambusae TaxID=1338426 RepID=UPI002781A35D|nr:hypothetical protein [Arthrobacter bambusae]MDQ0028860.1 hypothetical protein [Arthrobacter bambusae]MDQ0096346.1 hypothetical protein [Arthrobacter bambusae]
MAEKTVLAALAHGTAASRPLTELPVRGRVDCTGFIESVTYHPANEQAHFSAIVVDRIAHRGDTGPLTRLRVIWLGRRKVPGIEPGTVLRLKGMVMQRDGMPTMFNPRYEILSRQEHE